MGITLNGADVSAWADQSSNGFDAVQATPADQPLYTGATLTNGKQAVQFDGVSENLDLTGISIASGKHTIALVCNVGSPVAGAHMFDSTSGRLIIAPYRGTSVDFYDGAWNSVGSGAVSTDQAVVWHLHDAAASEIYTDGVLEGTDAYSDTAMGGTTRLGADTAASNPWFGLIREFIIFSPALDASGLASLFAYQRANSGTP